MVARITPLPTRFVNQVIGSAQNTREAPAGLRPPPSLSDAQRHALFLDIDGTLLDFAEDPDGVTVAAQLTDLLAQVRRTLGGALALVSGRSLSTIDRFFSPHAFAAAGLHGLELRNASGEVTRFQADLDAMETLRRGMHAIADTHPGLLLEDKGGSLALHYRRSPLLATIAAEEAMRLAHELGSDFVVQPGDHVVEIRPSGPDKGRAIEALMASPPFAGRTPIAVGDDHTDEHAFAAVEAFGGYGVIVGERRPTRAGHALADPAAVHAWLARFVPDLQEAPA